MLSRVADSAFWMSRYAERAENIARILDVNLQLMLDLPTDRAEQIAKNWWAVLASLGEEQAFGSQRKPVSQELATEYLVFERGNANSIVDCLANARENARTIREQISAEMWEQINRTYLWLVSKGARQFFERNAYEFFQRVKKALQLFQGITDSAMFHGEGWEFIQLGKYLERADKTSRLMDDEFFLLKPRREQDHVAETVMQWAAILRCCNARQVYQRLHPGTVDPVKASELLLLNATMPRSVTFCVDHLDQSLRRISGVVPGRFSNLAEKLSGRLLGSLNYSSIAEFWQNGLHASMDDLQQKLNAIGTAIAETYTRQTTLEVPVAYRTRLPAPQ